MNSDRHVTSAEQLHETVHVNIISLVNSTSLWYYANLDRERRFQNELCAKHTFSHTNTHTHTRHLSLSISLSLLFIAICSQQLFQNGSCCENIENKTMGQAEIWKRRAWMSLSAIHIENAALFCYWRCVIICCFLHDHDDIELCV